MYGNSNTDTAMFQHMGAFSSMLSIPKVSTLHSGNYTCVCRNKASSDQVSDLLQVNCKCQLVLIMSDDICM